MEEEDSRKIPQKAVLSFSVEEILKRKTVRRTLQKEDREDIFLSNETVEGSDVANDPILEDIKTRNKSLSDAETPNKEEDDRKFGILSKGGITVELVGKDLWKRFYKLGTEMIITKAGR
uniref:Tbox 22 [Jaculus jaculus] n=2 Tax=Lepeophtheirus salmonis TaxID=72036 RepID=A0A0K2T6Q7_LEPSM